MLRRGDRSALNNPNDGTDSENQPTREIIWITTEECFVFVEMLRPTASSPPLPQMPECQSQATVDMSSKSKQLTKISSSLFSRFRSAIHRWILTSRTSTIISRLSSRRLWEFRCRRTLSSGLHCMSCQRAIVIRARVALSLIVYRAVAAAQLTRRRRRLRMQISSHRIQSRRRCRRASSSASIRQPAIWPYRSISTSKPHSVTRWLWARPMPASRHCRPTSRSSSRCRTSTIICRSSSGMSTLSKSWNRRQLIHR